MPLILSNCLYSQQWYYLQCDSPKRPLQTTEERIGGPIKKVNKGHSFLKADQTSVASLKNTLLDIYLWKYTKKGAFHAASPNSTLPGCKKTLPSRRSNILNSRAVFSRCTVPACTLSNLIADWGRWTRATRGHSPPKMTAFNRLVFSLLVLRAGVEGVEENGMKPMSARDEMKSWRRVVISRTVAGEMKFYVPCQRFIFNNVLNSFYIFTEWFYCPLWFALGA